jgi:hypothetical protein
MHKKFYDNIKIQLQSEFYNNNIVPAYKDEYVHYMNTEIIASREYKINYGGEREKYYDHIYLLTEDKKTTERAREANSMHFLDAQLVRYVLENIEVLTIHDCFGVRLCELHKLIDIVNTYYSKEIGKETYSIFILI